MAAFYLQRYFSLVNWRAVSCTGDGFAKTAPQAKCLNVDLLISSIHEDFLFPLSLVLWKAVGQIFPLKLRYILGLRVQVQYLLFPRDTQHLAPDHAPTPELRLRLSNRAHHKYLPTFPIKKTCLQSWRIPKLQERAPGRHCSTEQHLNLKFATGLPRQPLHLMGFHGAPSFRSFVFPRCPWMSAFGIWNSLGSRVPRSQPL